MLFSEFQQNTGCKDTPFNHEIYRRLELMYMSDDNITKAEIYEYGKKLVDNSKTEAEIELENEIHEEIQWCKDEIKSIRNEIRNYEFLLKEETDPFFRKSWRDRVSSLRVDIRKLNRRIRELQWVLGENAK